MNIKLEFSLTEEQVGKCFELLDRFGVERTGNNVRILLQTFLYQGFDKRLIDYMLKKMRKKKMK